FHMRSSGTRRIACLHRSGLPVVRTIFSQLSGGQQQRVAIARALINDPEVLLADEPTGNLDSRTSIEIMAIFQQLNKRGITIIMVTHETDIAAYAQRNVIMRDGLILEDHLVSQRTNAAAQLQQTPVSTV